MSRGRTPATKDTYSTHDVAKICSVTPTTVIRWIEDGLIPAFKTVGGHRRVRREDLERVCRERGIPFDSPAGGGVGRVLVVDDEPVVLELVRDVVRDLDRQFEVEVARDAFDAGRLVATFRPQLIFLDLMMPGVDGFEVCRRLKQDPSTRNTEILAITGYYTEANTERILAAGAAACLRKPLDVQEVRAKVAEAFDLPVSTGAAGGESQAASAPRVLVFTQSPEFRKRVRGELAGADGVDTLTAQTAEDAALVAEAAPLSHALVMIGDPSDEGLEVVRRLASAARPPRIVAVHEAPTDEIRAAAREAGARLCLPADAVLGSVRDLLGV
ncbi:MAG: response regulator [Deltaproteobacteria bacterium]|nr:MAG: response regulator [Deltaproteobacteria bacterium]